MALLVVFFLRCIYLDYRRRLVVIGGCANISDDLNIPKNSRVSARETFHPISKPQNGF